MSEHVLVVVNDHNNPKGLALVERREEDQGLEEVVGSPLFGIVYAARSSVGLLAKSKLKTERLHREPSIKSECL